MNRLNGNYYRALKDGFAPGVTIQIDTVTIAPGHPATYRARYILHITETKSAALFAFDGEVQDIPRIVELFACAVELWIPPAAVGVVLPIVPETWKLEAGYAERERQ